MNSLIPHEESPSSSKYHNYPDHPHHRTVHSGATQLFVNGKPFLILGGELHNSSMSSAEYMAEHWTRLRDEAHINTLLGSVNWETIEPSKEGVFDFTELDKVILDARGHGLRLVLLWFGSYKNGRSTYVPRWVKTDPARFPRCQVRSPGQENGEELQTSEVVSPFSHEVMDADARAFTALMAHVREIDEVYGTVIMVQVENEAGLLGDSRDRSAVAEQAFTQPVPEELLRYLSSAPTHPAFKERFHHIPEHGKHSWGDVFGKGAAADEAFMAYHMAQFVSYVAAAGQKAYALPIYTNAWLNADRKTYGHSHSGKEEGGGEGAVSGGSTAGRYPSGGPVPHMLDIWRYHCEDVLDFFSPDIYADEYELFIQDYQVGHRSNILFVPEQRRDAYGCRRMWLAYAQGALGCSPFGIDTAELAVVGREFKLLSQIQPLLLSTSSKDRLGFFFDELDDTKREATSSEKDGDTAGKESWTRCFEVNDGDTIEVCVKRAFVFGKKGPGGGMVIHLGGLRFFVAGYGFSVTFRDPRGRASFVGLLSVAEKHMADKGELRTLRTMNGDETRGGSMVNMPNEDPDYGGYPVAVTIPARTGMAEVEVYKL